MSSTRKLGQRGLDKVSRIPVKVEPAAAPLRKPDWLRVRLPASPNFQRVKTLLRDNALHTVCEEASCPNIGECLSMKYKPLLSLKVK